MTSSEPESGNSELQPTLWSDGQSVLSATVALTPNRLIADTPMMAQYLALKNENPGCLLFFRLGDFYELFFEDAVVASRVLDIALTKRGKMNGADVPMCGVPAHACESYLARLIRRGYRVAVCEQTESPAEAKKRGAKAVVERQVVRIVTPGTLTEDNLLEAKQYNFLTIVVPAGAKTALAAVDISTGFFICEEVLTSDLSALLTRLGPSELILPDYLQDYDPYKDICEEWRDKLTSLPRSRFDLKNSQRRLLETYKVSTMDAFGKFSKNEQAACGLLLDYVWLTQRGNMPPLGMPQRYQLANSMIIDAATQRNLEIVQTLNGEKEGSLLHAIDYTITNSGARFLRAYLGSPMIDVAGINERLDIVGYFVDRPALRNELRDILKDMPDMERSLARLSLKRGGPRDLALIRNGLIQVCKVRDALLAQDALPPRVKVFAESTKDYSKLIEDLSRALAHELPVLARDGNFIAVGYSQELDHLRYLRHQSREYLVQLQENYISQTGINSLKIKHNNILGYHIEVTLQNIARVPATFVHRQTLANSARFTTPELINLEQKIAHAAEKALAIELGIYELLVNSILQIGPDIGYLGHTVGRLDVAVGFAQMAEERGYVRPIVDDSTNFIVQKGRHPVIETLAEQSFTPNDCHLSEAQRVWLLTGPNMAGKSTFLRQNALIAIMAQIACYVPAEFAHIGIIDRLFSRVGAGDELARGRSTFMVEMIETATILNQAGPKSLVILDEIGRGTATYDGVSIAWATMEYLHAVNRSRALFATHYHELTALETYLPHMACYTMAVHEHEGNVIFLHQIVPGCAERSYGIHVAQLAGIPHPVVERATEILNHLEKQQLPIQMTLPKAVA
jgi:DNA mismatch repair protein MutS